MYIEKIICEKLNFKKKYLKASYNKQGEITVEYRLSVPSWCNDSLYLGTNEKRAVIYARNKKYNNDGTKVTCKNITDVNGRDISKNKFYTESYTYAITDLLNKDLSQFFYEEYLNIFRELKSSILLEKIGDLSKKWDLLTSAKEITNEYVREREPYRYPYYNKVESLPF